MKDWVKLVISLALPQIAGLVAAYFTITGVGSWYQTIQKPDWNPPNWLFAPVWTTLYVMMGIAFYLVWRSNVDTKTKRPALIFWMAQLVLNFFWSIIFFYTHQIGYALVEIIMLWILILVTIFRFALIIKAAAWLMVPYISWVSFAGILNYTIWMLNR